MAGSAERSSGTAGVTVLFAEDHPIFSKGVREVIDEEERLTLVHQTDNGEDALHKCRELQPDIALLDINLPGMGGLDIARVHYKERWPTKIVFLTMFCERGLFKEALGLGIQGYVTKDCTPDEIRRAILSVADGRVWFSPSVSEFLVERNKEVEDLHREMPGLDALSETELLILKRVASDLTSKQIAEEFGLSPRTISNHRANICNKLGLRGSHSLIKFAFENRSKL